MFSLPATLHSYTGVWGRVRSSVHSPPDPSRKLPTAYTHFPPGFLYGRLKNWEVLGTGPTGDAPSLPSRRRCCTFREDKNGPLLQKKGGKKKQKKKQKKVPPSVILQLKGWSLDQRRKGGPSRRKPDPEEHRRVGGGSSPPAAATGLILVLFWFWFYFLIHQDFCWIFLGCFCDSGLVEGLRTPGCRAGFVCLGNFFKISFGCRFVVVVLASQSVFMV